MLQEEAALVVLLIDVCGVYSDSPWISARGYARSTTCYEHVHVHVYVHACACACACRGRATYITSIPATTYCVLLCTCSVHAMHTRHAYTPRMYHRTSYAGHYVLLVGVDGEHFLVKDPARKEECLLLPIALVDKARRVAPHRHRHRHRHRRDSDHMYPGCNHIYPGAPRARHGRRPALGASASSKREGPWLALAQCGHLCPSRSPPTFSVLPSGPIFILWAREEEECPGHFNAKERSALTPAKGRRLRCRRPPRYPSKARRPRRRRLAPSRAWCKSLRKQRRQKPRAQTRSQCVSRTCPAVLPLQTQR